MQPEPSHFPGLMTIISAAVAPVVLISSLAVFFSALTAKHSHMSDQVRYVVDELRCSKNDDPRRISLARQLLVFERRMDALWIATTLLTCALLCFITTVFVVIGAQQAKRIDIFGIVSLLMGLMLLVFAVIAELVEVGWSRSTVRYEVCDMDEDVHAVAKQSLTVKPARR